MLKVLHLLCRDGGPLQFDLVIGLLGSLGLFPSAAGFCRRVVDAVSFFHVDG